MKTEKFLNLENRTILCEIMDKHGSDKGNSHNYTKYYHELFKDRRLDTLNFFELGLGTNNTSFNFNMGDKGVPGASVYGWDEYFINGKIFGADIDKEILFDTERIKTFYCDQTNSLSIKDMWNNIPEYFDIIIEDGLHTFDANVNFFENSYHKINPENGIFIIEDIMNNKIADWLNKIKEYEIKFPQFDFEIIRLNCENPNITDNNLIKITPKKIKKDIIAIISYCDTEEKINVLIDNINLIRNKYSNFEIVIQANYPLPENVQKIVDYYFYMDLNKSSYSPIIVWRTLPFFTKKFIYSCDEDHGYSVCQMINHIAKYFIQYDKVLLMNYDAVLEDEHFYNHSELDSELLIYSWDEKGCSLILMSFNPASFYNKVSKFFTHESYLNLKNMTPEEKFFQFIKESNINYIKSNIFIKDKITGMPYLAAKNDFFKENLTCFNDNKLEIFLWHTNEKINKIKVNIDNVEYTLSNQNFKGAFENDSLIKYDKISKIDITSINDVEVNIPLKIIKNSKTEDTIKTQEKMLWNEEIDSNVFQANENWGLKNEELEIIENKEKNMKLKLIHILNRLDGERETNSINSLSPLKNLGVDYIQQVTPLYEGDGWKTKPITNIPGNNNHGKGHYGNYLSFMKAIKENFTEDLDALILCECDCVLSLPLDEFLNEMKKTLDFSKKHHIYHFSWGGRIVNGIENGDILKIDNEYPNYCVVGKIILAHFIILTKESREFFLRKVDSMGWDVADIWLNEAIFSAESDGLFSGPGRQANVLNSLAYQYEGVSDIDGIIKGKKPIDLNDPIDVITYNFNNKAGFVEILGNANKTYNVYFLLDNKLIYKSKIKSNNWAAASSEVNHIKIFENDLLIFHKLKEKNIIEHFYNNIDGWFDFQPVYTSMVEKFGDNSLFVEIGAWLGKSTAYMAVEIANSKKNIKFDVIDTWEGSTGSADTEWYNEIISGLDMSPYQTFLENTRPVKKYIRPIMGYSYDIVSDYADNSIDFLFIDGAHDYDSVKKDIHDWYPKIKFNGMIGGHDYGNNTFPGLIKAVNEFFGQENVTHIQPSAWLVDKEKFENSKK